jgi:hypothetical protein
VQAQEKARERALDAREAVLLKRRITTTAVVDLGDKKVILNRVPAEAAVQVAKTQRKEVHFDETIFSGIEVKEQKNLMLSGTIRDGISELWWQFEGYHYKVFVNANFLYFSGFDGDFEDEDTVYSVFPIMAGGNRRQSSDTGDAAEWQPTHADFTEGQIEYFVIKSSGVEAIDTEALKPIILMLESYRENHDEMRISYENMKKMQSARAAYLQANPPKKRDLIINSAPIDKSTHSSRR